MKCKTPLRCRPEFEGKYHCKFCEHQAFLDLIEESDEEEDFENVNPDKNIYLEKKYNFKCVYNKKYKLWIPVELSNDKISSKKDIYFIEKK